MSTLAFVDVKVLAAVPQGMKEGCKLRVDKTQCSLLQWEERP